MEQAGKVLIGFGVVIVLVGLALTFSDRLRFPLGHLPIDVRFERDNTTFSFGLGPSILISIVLRGIFMLINVDQRHVELHRDADQSTLTLHSAILCPRIGPPFPTVREHSHS